MLKGVNAYHFRCTLICHMTSLSNLMMTEKVSWNATAWVCILPQDWYCWVCIPDEWCPQPVPARVSPFWACFHLLCIVLGHNLEIHSRLLQGDSLCYCWKVKEESCLQCREHLWCSPGLCACSCSESAQVSQFVYDWHWGHCKMLLWDVHGYHGP